MAVMQAHPMQAPAIPEEEHTKACKPGDHLTQQVDRYAHTCVVCEHRINRDDVAIPDDDCPDSCFDRYAEEL